VSPVIPGLPIIFSPDPLGFLGFLGVLGVFIGNPSGELCLLLGMSPSVEHSCIMSMEALHVFASFCTSFFRSSGVILPK